MRRYAVSGQFLVFALATGSFAGATSNMAPIPLLKGIAADFAVSDAAVGQLATVHSLAATAMALLAAPWMDRFARRSLLRLCVAVIAIGTVLSALAPSFLLLLLGRAIAGTGAGVIFPTVTATAAELFEESNRRAQAIGATISAASISVVLSIPILAQIDGLAGWRWSFMAVLLPFVLVLAATWLLPSRPSGGSEPPRESVWSSYLSRYHALLSRTETTALLGLVALRSLVWNGWLVYLGAYIVTVFAVSNSYVSLIFLVFGLAHALGSNLTPFLMRRLSNRSVVVLALTVLTFNLLAAGVVYLTAWSMFVFVVLGGLVGSSLSVTINMLLLDANRTAAGAALSFQSAVSMLGGALGTAFAGLLLSALDSYQAVYQALGLITPLGLVFLLINARSARVAPAELAAPFDLSKGEPLG